MILSRNPTIGVAYPNAWSSALVSAMAGILDVLSTWRERAHQRASLASLDDHMLADIGLNRTDVYRECRKPFWMV